MTDETDNDRMLRLVTGNDGKPLPRRFYKDVGVNAQNGILLDGKTVKTPLKAALRLPNANLAQAVAGEWAAQGKSINFAAMPLTKLANTAIDRATHERKTITRELADYANADLICYRAAQPSDLVELQQAAWDPVLAWVQNKLGVRFEWTRSISHKPQTGEALATFEAYLNELTPWHLTAHYNISTLTGSVLITTMLIEGGMTLDQAWTAAHVDEDWQIARWGEDTDAIKRRSVRHGEAAMAALYRLIGRGGSPDQASGSRQNDRPLRCAGSWTIS